MTHYDTLGVPPDATDDEIKRAFRKKASEHHPDKGGDTEEMAKANRAYAVLADPQARRRYDEAGHDDDRASRPPKHEMARAALRDCIEKALEIDGANISDTVRKMITAAANKMDSGEPPLKARRERLLKRREKVRTKGGAENLAHAIIDAKIQAIDKSLAEVAEAREVQAIMLAMLDAYEDDEEAPLFSTPTRSFTTGASFPWPTTGSI